ncbi:hypothetical protein ACOSP7_008426 [Xanthoceras sorbifolium]
MDTTSPKSPSKTKRSKFDNDYTPSHTDTPYFERDPGKCIPIWQYPINKQDEVRRVYIDMGPCQPIFDYPLSESGNQNRRFQRSWFTKFSWLEYSIENDRAYCFPCYLFDSSTSQYRTFTIEGFNNWKRVNCGDNCPLKKHEGGDDHRSLHNTAIQQWANLKDPSLHIDKRINKQSSQAVMQNRLLLKTSIETVKWLALQGCAFRGNDESINSTNRENFIELIKLQARVNNEIAGVVLDNAAQNAKYTSPMIQHELLKILADCVRDKIREEIGDAKFCILIDESVDESNKEQMAIILRYVDVDGFVRERFFEIVGVGDTNASTLKREICIVLDRYNILTENLRGQGYDGASNMRGQWNGLQALFLKDCPYAYYIHCFAHRLQLALVAVSKEVREVWLFFSKLSSVVNFVGASAKRHSELKLIREDEIIDMIASAELESGTGANQIRSLQRAGPTRWSSHFTSVSRLIDMFGSTCTLLEKLSDVGLSGNIRGEAQGAYKDMRNFDFVFILLLLHRVLGISDVLCRALQMKSQDILNALNLVSTTKLLLQQLREDEWDDFFESVVSFCKRHDIDIPNMGDRYMEGTRRSCQQRNNITVEHYYHFNIFNAVIDFHLMELNNRFTEKTVELLILSEALNPIDGFKSFSIDAICTLAEKFYPRDFTGDDINALKRQLGHYKLDVICQPQFQNLASLSELCRLLVQSRRSQHYFLIDRLIRLVLTLPVSTATTERAFSAMKLIKTSIRNKMEQEFLANSMVIYIEREIAETIDSDFVIDKFDILKNRKIRLK